MVTLQEWLAADNYSVFENKINHKKITKWFLKENLRTIEKYMIKQHVAKGEGPTAENVHRIQDLIAAALENFEIADIKITKETEDGVIIADKPHNHIKSESNRGGYCYKCGLQKEGLEIVEKEGLAIKMCKECLGI